MRVATGLLTEESFKVALADEAWAERGLMPGNPVIAGLYLRKAAAPGWVARQCSGEFHPVPEQVVTVRKSRHGVRPVAELSIRDRLLYRTLVARWKEVLPAPDRSGSTFEEFQRAPLDQSERA